MIPPHAIATPESMKSCAPCSWCWEEPPQLENRLDGQPKGTTLYCRLLRNTSTCPGPRGRTLCNIREELRPADRTVGRCECVEGACYEGEFWVRGPGDK